MVVGVEAAALVPERAIHLDDRRGRHHAAEPAFLDELLSYVLNRSAKLIQQRAENALRFVAPVFAQRIPRLRDFKRNSRIVGANILVFDG